MPKLVFRENDRNVLGLLFCLPTFLDQHNVMSVSWSLKNWANKFSLLCLKSLSVYPPFLFLCLSDYFVLFSNLISISIPILNPISNLISDLFFNPILNPISNSISKPISNLILNLISILI